MNKSKENVLAEIKRWYNGYRFSGEQLAVYNPFSTLLLFDKYHFANYWFETGTPTFLIDLIKEKNYDVQINEEMQVEELAFSSYEVNSLTVEPLLYQTGYLTIKDSYQEEGLEPIQKYVLGYPNFEVKNAFLQYLVDTFSNVKKEHAGSHLSRLIAAIKQNDLESFFTCLKSFFANIPYDLHIAKERYYQTIFYLVFTLLGLRIQAEVKTNKGRADVVIETTTHVYIFEFKLFETKESALMQIKEKKYWEKYCTGTAKNGVPTIVLVGVEFDPAERNIGEWVTEELSQC